MPKLMFMEWKGRGGKEENEEMAERDRGRGTEQARPLRFRHRGRSTCESNIKTDSRCLGSPYRVPGTVSV